MRIVTVWFIVRTEDDKTARQVVDYALDVARQEGVLDQCEVDVDPKVIDPNNDAEDL